MHLQILEPAQGPFITDVIRHGTAPDQRGARVRQGCG